MINKTLITILLAAFISGCASSPDSPVTSETPSEPGQNDFLPSPADGSLIRGVAYLNSVDLLTLESFPLQFMLVLKGELPTPCHQLRIAVNPPDTTNKIVVDVYSISNPDAMCIQVLEPFEVNYPLGSFPPGSYSLWVNGEMAAEFDS
jgi:inhibitor of cysteine peptidase